MSETYTEQLSIHDGLLRSAYEDGTLPMLADIIHSDLLRIKRESIDTTCQEKLNDAELAVGSLTSWVLGGRITHQKARDIVRGN